MLASFATYKWTFSVKLREYDDQFCRALRRRLPVKCRHMKSNVCGISDRLIGLWTDVTRGSFECESDTRAETGQLVLTSLLWAQSVKRYWDEALVVRTFCGERTEAGLTRRHYCACVSAGQEHEVSASIPIPSCVSFPDQSSWHPKMQLFPTIWRSASSAEGKWGLPYQPVSSDQVPAQKCCNWELLPPIAWGLVWDGSQWKTLRICVNVEVQRPGNWVISSFG